MWRVIKTVVGVRPLTVGSKVAFVAYFLRRRLAYVYEYVEFDLTGLN